MRIALFASLVLLPACYCSHHRPDEAPDAPSVDAGSVDALVPQDAGTPPATWRWSSPEPQGNELASVWGFAPDDVWAVGENGTILHFDGTSWAPSASGTTSDLHGVWGAAPDDVWVVGGRSLEPPGETSGVLLHWDGATWTSTPSDTTGLRAVIGTTANDVWAVGRGTIVHYDGAAWTRSWTGMHNMLDVWAAGPDDVWAVGDYEPVLHFDGESWSETSGLFGSGAEGAVWGSSSDDVWTGSFIRPLRHWDGAEWTDVEPQVMGICALWGASADDVWATTWAGTLAHWDGAEWRAEASGVPVLLRDVWGSGPSDVWAVGGAGTLLHFDGEAWDAWTPISPNHHLNAVWATADDDVWAVGYRHDVRGGGAIEETGAILHGDGRTWRAPFPSIAAVGTSSIHLHDVWASARDDAWAVGDHGTAVHFDGTAWVAAAISTSSSVRGVWGSSRDDVWAVGQGVFHWDGTEWSTSVAASFLEAVWGSGPTDVWAAGDGSTVLHWDGSAWSTTTVGEPAERTRWVAIGGTAPDDVWLTGAGREGLGRERARTFHWDGASWARVRGPLDDRDGTSIGSVWASAPDDGWAIATISGTTSYETVLLAWDGERWSEPDVLPLGVEHLDDVSGRGPDDVWAVGSSGVIVHRAP